jgi:hypothetical protein
MVAYPTVLNLTDTPVAYGEPVGPALLGASLIRIEHTWQDTLVNRKPVLKLTSKLSLGAPVVEPVTDAVFLQSHLNAVMTK